MIALLIAAVIVAPAPRVERFALVVGHNQPPRPDLPRLRYGDDDAVRWSVLLGTFGAHVELLTTLDGESRQLYGDRAPPMRPPTRAEIGAAMARIGAGVRAARAAGARTVFYFVYAGHGDVDNGEGYVALDGDRLYRRDLEDAILGASGADTNHVVIDACRSYYLVYDRGPGGTRRPWHSPYFVSGAAARFRNTGFLLASSSEAPTHEWEEFQAGIFSHEVRSGLLGSADLDGDGRISYDEIAAFVQVANRPIRNAKFRPAFLARPPESGDGVFLDLAGATGGVVRTGKRPSARYLLEDQLGVRWADFHPSARHEVILRLPAAPWLVSHFFFRPAGGEEEYRVSAGQTVSLADERPVPVATVSRGAAHEAFAQLFAEAFDESDVKSLKVDLSVSADPARRPLRTAAIAGMVAGGAALGAAAVVTVVGIREREDARDASGERRAQINRRLDTLATWRAVTGVAGALLAAGGLALYLYDARAERVAVTPVPGGGVMTVSAGF